MKHLLKLEELAQFLACLALLAMNAVPWWAYVLLVIGPDISGPAGFRQAASVSASTTDHPSSTRRVATAAPMVDAPPATTTPVVTGMVPTATSAFATGASCPTAC